MVLSLLMVPLFLPNCEIFAHIRRCIPHGMLVSFELIPREANMVDDCLAKNAHVFGFGVHLLHFPLMECRNLLYQDAMEALFSLSLPAD